MLNRSEKYVDMMEKLEKSMKQLEVETENKVDKMGEYRRRGLCTVEEAVMKINQIVQNFQKKYILLYQTYEVTKRIYENVNKAQV